jgi:histidine triad (HIT) family protein
MNDDCTFCRIIRREIPSSIVFEDKKVLAFLDIYPISHGHVIIIPKSHYQTIEDIPDDELTHLIIKVKMIAHRIHHKLNCDGFNIMQNNFKAAGQVIKHVHFHIIPRKEKDMKFSVHIPKEQISQEELEKIRKLITS